MRQPLGKLYENNLITPIGLFRLVSSIFISGINLMTLLRFSARTYPDMPAIVDQQEEINYKDLYQQSRQLATNLQEEYGLKTGKKVAIICNNHIPMVKTLSALSYLGVDVYLLDIEMTVERLNSLIKKHDFDLIVYDIVFFKTLHQSVFVKTSLLSYHLTFPSIDDWSKKQPKKRRSAKKGEGKIISLSTDSTGEFTYNELKPAVFTFLNPFYALLDRLSLGSYNSVYVATPLYQGFGMAAVLISLILGKKVHFLTKYHTNDAKLLMLRQRVQVAILTPEILGKLLDDKYVLELIYLKCLISSGASLSTSLVQKAENKLGKKLANLYGSAEAGFSILATPADLKYHPNTIGKKIAGVKINIFDDKDQEVSVGKVGRLCIKNKETVKKQKGKWIDTGDLAYVDKNGYYFLCGPLNDRIVCGGELVFPVELEHILIQHQEVDQVAVVGIDDQDYGQVLKAFVVLKKESSLKEEAIQDWLKERSTTYQRPKLIVFLEEMPLGSLGDVNKEVLA